MIGEDDPTDVFDDLDQLRAKTLPAVATTPAKAFKPLRRQRSKETFARIPHERAPELRALSGTAWMLLIKLDRLVLMSRRNPVRLSSCTLRIAGLSRWAKARALAQLERAGVVCVHRNKDRRPVLVTHLWYPEQS